MKKYKYYLSILSLILFSFAITSCDEDGQIDGEDIRNTIIAPTINSFFPEKGTPGTEIMIEGENLSNVDSIFIGNAIVKVKNKISNTQILAEVTANAKTGKIKVRNPKGTAESEKIFNVTAVVPTLDEVVTNVEGELTVGESNVIKGTNLKSVTSVLIAGVEAKIEFVSDTEIKFIVPSVSGVTSSKVTIQYLNGETTESVNSNDTYNIVGSAIVPSITSCPSSANIWTEITITGNNLDVSTHALFKGITIEFTSKTVNEIKLTIPTNFSSETTADLILVYNEGDEVIASQNFTVTIPTISGAVNFYGGLVIEAQDPSMSNQFFHAPTGVFYSACTDFNTIRNNTYFFITWSDSNQTFQINNPNNSANQTSMFFCNDTQLPGEKLPNIVKFKILKTSTKAENEFINKVKSRTLGQITPEIVKDAGISNASTNAPRYNLNGLNPSSPFEEGSVLMFQKYNSTGATVEEVGFIEVVKVNVPDDVKRKATMKFNCFFQK